MALFWNYRGKPATSMLKNYFKIAFRNLTRTKIYSFINIFGLSLGVACCLLLSLYVQDEFSYDRHHQRRNDLYRICTQFEADLAGFDKLGSVSPPITMTLKDELPEIEAAARVAPLVAGESGRRNVFDVLSFLRCLADTDHQQQAKQTESHSASQVLDRARA